MKMRSLLAAVLAVTLFHGTGRAASWPERTVKFIVPFPAGGPADGSMRIVSKRLTEIWGKPVIVENKPGAHGMIDVAKSPGDGYTLLLGAGSGMVTTPLMNKKLPYKPESFAPVSMLSTSAYVLSAHAGTGIRSVKDLIDKSKANPGSVNFSSAGIGSGGHLMMEMFQQLTGTKLVHIPYRGGAPAVNDLAAGVVQVGINATPTVIPYVQNGKLVPLAIPSEKRDRMLPGVPTMTEAGIKGFEFEVWYAIFAPASTPAAVVEKISADVRMVLAESETQKLFANMGNEPAGSTPQELARLVKDETKAWADLVRQRNLTIDE